MRKLLLLVAMVLGALSLMASSAFAETEAPEEPVTIPNAVESETTGELCGDVQVINHVAGGGCNVHAVGHQVLLIAHVPILGEIIGHSCDNEFVGSIDADGEGWIGMNQISITNHSEAGATGNCGGSTGVRQCSEMTAAEQGTGHSPDWHIQGYEDAHNGDLWLDVAICVEDTTIGTVAGDLWVRVHTDVDRHVTGFESEGDETIINPANHGHLLRNVEAALADVEFYGDWDIEGTDTVEIMD